MPRTLPAQAPASLPRAAEPLNWLAVHDRGNGDEPLVAVVAASKCPTVKQIAALFPSFGEVEAQYVSIKALGKIPTIPNIPPMVPGRQRR
jgi:hypothetical protein